MQSRKIALFKGLRDPQIQGYATCATDIKKHIEACENKKLVQYHREGKSWPKAKMGGIILNRHIEGAEELRKDSNFYPTAVGDLFMFDKDGLEKATPFNGILSPEELCKKLVETLDEQVPGFADCCVFEKSCSGSLHGAVPCFSGNPKQDLLFYEKVLGVEVDKSVLNPSRCYIVTHNILHGSYECLFKEVPQKVIEGLRSLSLALSQGEGTLGSADVSSVVQEEVKVVSSDLYAELLADVIRQNGVPQKGERNSTMWRIAVDLIAIGCNQLDDLLELFRAYSFFGLSEQETRSCISSALKKEAPERSLGMREAVSAVLEKRPHTTVQLSAETSEVIPVNETEACHIVSPSESETESAATPAGWTPWGVLPAMPAKLPSFVRHLVSPIRAQHTWAHALTLSESALATYLKNVTFTELTGLSKPLYNGWFAVSLAPSSSGKSVATMCIKAITKKLDEEDRDVRAKLQEWVDEDRTRKSSDGVRKPKNTSRLCGSDTTSSGLFQRFKELDPGTALYISTPELMTLKNVASGDYVKFFLMAHDAEEYSVERSTSTGESGRATLSLNVSAMAPIGIGQEFFAGHTEDGLVSRFIFSTIEENKNWDDLEPLYDTTKLKNYADGFEKYIQRLEAAEGKHFAKREIEDFCKGLQEEIFQMAAEYNSESLRILSRRAIIHLQKMCYLYMILEGRWTADLQEFMRYRWRLMLGSMYRVLGKKIESEISKSTSLLNACKSQSGPVSILASMPEHFSLHEFMARRKSLNFADQTESAAKAQLRTLKHRGLVQQDGTGYINLKKKS